MALAHRERPIWGVQFHPESIGTPAGALIVRNFLGLAPPRRGAPAPRPRRQVRPTRAPAYEVLVRSIDRVPDAALTFGRLFGADRHAFWLDGEAGGRAEGRSFMGSADRAGGEVLSADTAAGSVRALRPATGESETVAGTIFDLLRRRLSERQISTQLPFDFAGGYVGYLGYGIKADLGSPNRVDAETPDACLMFPSRMVVLEHRTGRAFAICIAGPEFSGRQALAEVEALQRELEAVPTAAPRAVSPPPSFDPACFEFALDRSEYLAAVKAAQRALHAGDSYELCLTTQIETRLDPVDPLAVYLRQRAFNPAPHAAFLRCGELAVLSSSPERFLRISRQGTVEARPIKGTRPRAADRGEDERLREELRTSVKERAENMMIVDLLRNDLGRVCRVGSIDVDGLLEVESHEHVHQLVSTIRGRLSADSDPLACVEACFPGGSMTGAPKLRSLAILDSLEPRPRGVYAGALGYFGLGGGADLSIVIRSAVIHGDRAAVGSGGAITVLSDPEEEWDEMMLKARPLLDVLSEFAASPSAQKAVSPRLRLARK